MSYHQQMLTCKCIDLILCDLKLPFVILCYIWWWREHDCFHISCWWTNKSIFWLISKYFLACFPIWSTDCVVNPRILKFTSRYWCWYKCVVKETPCYYWRTAVFHSFWSVSMLFIKRTRFTINRSNNRTIRTINTKLSGMQSKERIKTSLCTDNSLAYTSR